MKSSPVRREVKAGGFDGVERFHSVREVFGEVDLAGFAVAVGVFKVSDAVKQCHGQGLGHVDQARLVKIAGR